MQVHDFCSTRSRWSLESSSLDNSTQSQSQLHFDSPDQYRRRPGYSRINPISPSKSDFTWLLLSRIPPSACPCSSYVSILFSSSTSVFRPLKHRRFPESRISSSRFPSLFRSATFSRLLQFDWSRLGRNPHSAHYDGK